MAGRRSVVGPPLFVNGGADTGLQSRPHASGTIPTAHHTYYTYLLISERDKRCYIGYTSNLPRRMVEHENGSVDFNKGSTPHETGLLRGLYR